MDHPNPLPDRCRTAVWHRDAYRRNSRKRNFFKFHYRRAQCKRKPKENGYCWQHQYLKIDCV